MANLKALFWAGVAAVGVTAAGVTAGAYTGEFGFSGNSQTQPADAAQPVGASQGDTLVPAAGIDVQYVENEDGEHEGDDDDYGERDD